VGRLDRFLAGEQVHPLTTGQGTAAVIGTDEELLTFVRDGDAGGDAGLG